MNRITTTRLQPFCLPLSYAAGCPNIKYRFSHLVQGNVCEGSYEFPAGFSHLRLTQIHDVYRESHYVVIS